MPGRSDLPLVYFRQLVTTVLVLQEQADDYTHFESDIFDVYKDTVNIMSLTIIVLHVPLL